MKRTLSLLAALMLPILPVLAQNAFRGAYFMDTYLYGHTMNPALCANRSYFGLGVGHIDLQMQSNLGATTFLYPTRGGAVETFLSEGVSSDTFLGKIHRHNTENINAEVDILNFGFWTRKDQFHSFSLNLHLNESAAAPYDLFRFLKDGSTDGADYDLAGFGARARAYAEAAYGISFPVTERLRIGGKVKALVGLAYADARFDRFDVTLGGGRWYVSTDGRLLASNLPATQTSGSVAITDTFDFDDFDIKQFRPSGGGLALDLGTTWDVLPWLQLSASVTDLGFIRWKMDARMGTAGSWEYAGFDNISFEGNDNLQGQLDAKLEELNRLIEFHRTDKGSPMDFLPATLYLGAKAHPSDWFSAGLLGTVRSEGKYSWAELRGAVNLEPVHWFGWSGSAAYGSFGPKLSTLLNLRLPLLALYVGAEMSSPFFVSSEPRAQHRLRDYFDSDGGLVAFPRDNLNFNLMIGLNMVFGQKRQGPAHRIRPRRSAEGAGV
ncbi:MAG: hypothetical protein IJ654_08975 [Bacteroidales bacterium]|nr:hypothetical protein [Bacteroidales bacterium]